VSKIKDYLLSKYEEGEICLACSQSYPPNGILFCDDCNKPDLPCCGACGQFYSEKETALDGFHSSNYYEEA
jgi:predicted amidophosphoribosyltransferase